MSGIDAAWERAWLRQLRAEWAVINQDRLDGRLRAPMLRLDEALTRLGSWHGPSRTLTIARRHLLNDPWREVVATLRHEVAHQVVDELLGGADRPHGARFHDACRMLDISASGHVDEDTHTPEAAKVLARVRKLMALAESDNPHEAQAAMARAHQLLLAHNLRHPADPARPDYVAQVVGRSAAALPLVWKLVGGILERFFFVECVWTSTYNPRKDRGERELELLGRRHDVELAAWVHDFLHAEAERLWRRARTAGLPGGARAKREYQIGVLTGFRDKLAAEREQCAARGLVWVGDADLQRYKERRFPHLRSLRGGGVRRSAAHASGRSDGAAMTLRRPVEQAGTGGGKLPSPER